MYYVYLLYSQSADETYCGATNDLKRRITEHQSGSQQSTAHASDWEIIYYEAYQSEEDARRRESKLKQYGSSYGHLKKRVAGSLDMIKN